MATHYCRILENLLTKITLTKEAVIAICGEEPASGYSSYASKLIREMKANEHIRSTAIVREDGNQKKRTEHFYITPEGIRYLKRCAEADERTEYEVRKKTSLPWLRYIDEEATKGMAVLGDIQSNRERAYHTSESAMICELAGASVPTFLLNAGTPVSEISNQVFKLDDMYKVEREYEQLAMTEEEYQVKKLNERKKIESKRKGERKCSTYELIDNAIRKWCEAENLDYEKMTHESTGSASAIRADYMRFVHPRTVKYVSMMNNPGLQDRTVMRPYDTFDVNRARFTGLVQSHCKTLLTFSTLDPITRWQTKFTKVEVAADMRWKNKLKDDFRDESIIEGTCGVILIQNIIKFRKFWTNAKKLRRRKQGFLGENYEHLYLVEMKAGGIRMLRDIALTKNSEYEVREAERAMAPDFAKSIGCQFERNEDFYTDMFPLKLNWGGTWFYFAIGTWIDLNKIREIQNMMEADPETGCGIICEAWQHEYYKAMIPEMSTFWKGKTAEELGSDFYGEPTEDDVWYTDETIDVSIEENC